jgi:hypothetical protein
MKRDIASSELPRWRNLSVLFAAAALAAGCAQMGGGSKSESAPAPPAAAPAAAGAKPAAAPASAKIGPGMNAQGQVIDTKVVEEGYGQKVKGMDDWEGEITGVPVPGTKFTQLKIGMGMAQAREIVGNPTDQGGYVTGKAFIPWYFGSGKYRHELVYKGYGRLIFASPSSFDFASGKLVWIIHSANESGYR